MPPKPGSVTLAGAGPGDPELLTLKALRALESADVILYDSLVPAEILALARPESEKISVGKMGYGPSCRQDDINALMIAHARAGKHVLRLKGGDPLIFSRAGEELLAAKEAGIPVEIIPGITAAQAAAAALGVPLTHRLHARRLQYVTGHDHKGGLPTNIDWKALADPGATTIIYMAKKTLAAFSQTVQEHGLPPETPAVAIINATLPTQHIIKGTIATLPGKMDSAPAGPVTVLIGKALT